MSYVAPCALPYPWPWLELVLGRLDGTEFIQVGPRAPQNLIPCEKCTLQEKKKKKRKVGSKLGILECLKKCRKDSTSHIQEVFWSSLKEGCCSLLAVFLAQPWQVIQKVFTDIFVSLDLAKMFSSPCVIEQGALLAPLLGWASSGIHAVLCRQTQLPMVFLIHCQHHQKGGL